MPAAAEAGILSASGATKLKVTRAGEVREPALQKPRSRNFSASTRNSSGARKWVCVWSPRITRRQGKSETPSSTRRMMQRSSAWVQVKERNGKEREKAREIAREKDKERDRDRERERERGKHRSRCNPKKERIGEKEKRTSGVGN